MSLLKDEATTGTLVLLFVAFSLFVGSVLRELNKKTGLPYTPMLFCAGLFFGCMNGIILVENPFTIVGQIDPNVLLFIFLPILIFDGGYAIEFHIFKKQFFQTFILAFPCVIIGSFLNGFAIKYILFYDDTYYTIGSALMFGAVLSCTDTVAVIALLKEVGAPIKFNSLIEGESLMNDASSRVLMLVFGQLAHGNQTSLYNASVYGFCLCSTGIISGIIFGILTSQWISRILKDEVLTISITIFSVYLLYFITEFIDYGIPISSIVAIVTYSLWMSAFGKVTIRPEVHHAVEIFWKSITYYGETLIFLIAGIIIGVKVLSGNAEEALVSGDYIKLIALYIIMNFVRFICIAMFYPILKKLGYGINWVDIIVLSWGGLRGAVGISFALILNYDDYFSPKMRDIMLFDMSGCALLTLLINAPTSKLLISKLGMTKVSHTKMDAFSSFIDYLLKEIDRLQTSLKKDRFLETADWEKVLHYSGKKEFIMLKEKIAEDIALSKKLLKEEFIKLESNKIHNLSEGAQEELVRPENKKRGSLLDGVQEEFEYIEEEDIVAEARFRYLKTLMGVYYELFETGQCSPTTLLFLQEITNIELDNEHNKMSDWTFIHDYFSSDYFTKIFYYLKDAPLIGKTMRKFFYGKIAEVYDATCSFIKGHELADEKIQELGINSSVLEKIFEESSQNKKQAENYLVDYASVSFPDVSKNIQIRKASNIILNSIQKLAEEVFKNGIIDDKEYLILDEIIRINIRKMINYSPEITKKTTKEFLKEIKFFSFFSPAEIDKLTSNSMDKFFSNQQLILRETALFQGIYVVKRGVASEYCNSRYLQIHEKYGEGKIMGLPNLIIKPNNHYSNYVSEYMLVTIFIPESVITPYIKKKKNLQEYLWKESFYVMSKLNKELEPFKKWKQSECSFFLDYCDFAHYGPNEIYTSEIPAVMLCGSIVEKNNESHEIKGVFIFYGKEKVQFVVKKPASFLTCENFHKFYEINPKGEIISQEYLRNQFRFSEVGFQKYSIEEIGCATGKNMFRPSINYIFGGDAQKNTEKDKNLTLSLNAIESELSPSKIELKSKTDIK